MEPYLSPVLQVFELAPSRVICQSGRQLNYGREGAAGGGINDDNYVDGGEF